MTKTYSVDVVDAARFPCIPLMVSRPLKDQTRSYFPSAWKSTLWSFVFCHHP